MENIISLAKRRGFIFQGSEIYGGLAGTWDYGPFGVALKQNIKNIWWKRFVTDRTDMYGMDAAILMNQTAWKASGHVSGFSDPLVECTKCKRRFRADQIEDVSKCPECGSKLGESRQFNMMFKTNVGAIENDDSVSYLRPETAQGMFVNFKNILDTFHPKLPFGMAQIGKAFRNEIAPRDFIFRTREFEQMEIEYFVEPENWEKVFNEFVSEMNAFIKDVGITKEKVSENEIAKDALAHYSKRTIDFEFDYPFGRKELYGLAYRTDFDLKAHSEMSKVDLSYFDEEKKTRFIPHVIEPSLGVDRTVLAILSSAYTEDELGGEKRAYLKLNPAVAPIKVAVFPLLKNKEVLTEKAEEIFKSLKSEFGAVVYDETGSIGKRYRKQDEIGTPYCVTVDFDTLEKGIATVRDRDTGEQEKVETDKLIGFLSNKL
ncbi:MAG: glycine--tRNA ligase [Candidatus Taylorbacteria bacterium CG10_big_fil_rev_8_21_14_0_10_41_48]|uniref:Glycine--tRNA ligase n=1 Tax=Candidatus Taylorbacteria bacterium CG10_big_fil_rev_8_21_14_0_10_41_48 TaxID=1975024 RepID=A0A2M8LDC6_9BACT|nr:MAG: glycine--tRNA ligase [Candidatus Taylorbacteria bacterium CG10_big_fil_rev_8_21_14_0_10_41_48]